ncbi:MAG TPA: magnesium/cobalt transporter CorA [Symbiobacteriaceae bacterium]|jgi:magnesium transporter
MIQALLIHGENRSTLPWPEARQTWAQAGGVLWVDVSPPTEAEIGQLATDLGLHPMVARACLHPEHRPRLREFKNHLLLVLNAVGRNGGEARSNSDLGRWRMLELNVIIGQHFLVTVHPDTVPAVSTLWQRWTQTDEGRPTVEYLLYSIGESVLSGYYLLLDRVDKDIDQVEDLILTGETVGLVDRLFGLKRHMLYLRRVLGPQRDALGGLMRREFAMISTEGRPYFVDLYEHSLRLFDLLDTYRDLVSSSMDAYLSTVSNQMNRIMQTLTIVSTIMLPLTLITGIFGMNFVGIPLIGTRWGFTAIMAVMGAIGIVMIIYFRRKKWM